MPATQTATRDLYEVLGVPRAATPADLKKAYRTLAQKYHPDKNSGDKTSEDKFKEAANAYQILSDTDKRSIYDRYGFEGLRRGSGADPSGPGFEGFHNVEDIFSAFGDLFGDFFGGRGRQRPSRGTDLRTTMTITFAEAVWGTTKDLKIARPVSCKKCGSTGAASGTRAEACHACQGRGQIAHPQGFFMVQSQCPHCRGVGKIVKNPCGDCQGRGVRNETQAMSVTIPAGIGEGQMLRISGKGEAIANGSSGDLYVVINVQPDDRFARDEFDVTSLIPINIFQAMIGGEIEIDTLDDDCEGTTTLELPPGVQPGDIIARKGQGVPRPNGGLRGDHLIQFKIEIPKKLTSKQEKLLRELAEDFGEARKTRRKHK
jgi:molecular chaperone DnaJ